MTEPSQRPFELVTSHHVLAMNIGVSGNLFGGVMLCWVDEAAALYADKVALNTFVTYEMERVRFVQPCHTGDVVQLFARVAKVSRSGLQIEMKAERVNRGLGTTDLVLTTHVVMVAIDPDGRKTPLRFHPDYRDLEAPASGC